MLRCVGILLAGGASRRFGADNKLTVDAIDGVAIGIHSAEQLQAAVDELLVVVPADDPAAYALFNRKYEVSVCPDAREGIGRSIAHGAGARPDADAWLIALADMPFIQSETIRAVVTALISETTIARPRFAGRAGHPVGFGAAYGRELMSLQGDAGAQSVLNAHRDAVVFVDTDDAGVVTDIDRPEDIEAGRKLFRTP